uniref:Uncharacterized protein n=1 Tax=Panagrellus redivivus TaxID=6233 RepID=A0A7E4V7P7_PANRE
MSVKPSIVSTTKKKPTSDATYAGIVAQPRFQHPRTSFILQHIRWADVASVPAWSQPKPFTSTRRSATFPTDCLSPFLLCPP